MEMLALLLVFPLAWPFVAKMLWQHEITLGELAINVVVGAVVVLAGWAGGRYSQMADTEILNGQVVNKTTEHVSCSHSYACNCRQTCTGSGNNKSCSETCDTCYRHSYDVDWTLRTTVEPINVSRIDEQGVQEPPRWSRAKVGDPVAVTHTHVNYIKAAPDSLFSAAAEKSLLEQYGASIPAYPADVFDLHYANRVLPVGVAVPDLDVWNRDLALRLRGLGPSKQVNWVVVLTKQGDPAWADAVRVKWLGGKKNDVIVVLGTPEYPKVQWARVLSWTDQELFKVRLRDDLAQLPLATPTAVFDLMEKHTKESFVRKKMKDFEYLASQIEPPTWMLWLLFVISVITSVGLSMYLARNEYQVGGMGRFRSRRSFR